MMAEGIGEGAWGVTSLSGPDAVPLVSGALRAVKKKRAAHLTKSATASARYNEGIGTASGPLNEAQL